MMTFRKAITHPSLHALDINSRFETSPGVKDVGLIEKFLVEKTEDGRPKTEDRRRKTEDRRRKEDGRRKTEDGS
jgi:hypothetical protein